MPKEIKAYECEFCPWMMSKYKSSVKRHERKCIFNPAVRACITCHKEANNSCDKTADGDKFMFCDDWIPFDRERFRREMELINPFSGIGMNDE